MKPQFLIFKKGNLFLLYEGNSLLDILYYFCFIYDSVKSYFYYIKRFVVLRK